MSLCAKVIAVGPYSPAIAVHLAYPAEYYRDTRTGARVIVELFEILEGTHAGTDFAKHLGISEVWDFNQHRIEPARIDVAQLRAHLASLGDSEDYLADLESLQALRDHGFEFMFMPQG